ncbi:MAG: maleylpyruvate isomerase family mycothiol-dependent enzyme [Micrococcales bacterium]|nr:maleylpyruvate isomerase family mycothiol-dependent enzyme [Micrococcales bacterium]
MDAASQYDRTASPLTRVIDQVPLERWESPSPCEGWTAADVVTHLIETQRDFILRQGVQLPLEAPKVSEGVALAWRTHMESIARELADPAVGERSYTGAFGPTTIGATMADFYGFDMIVHRWDIARAAGQASDFSEREMDQLETSIDQFGEHMYAEGVCKAALPAPDGATRQEAILARLGRDPRA